jgi:hypothetical protein
MPALLWCYSRNVRCQESILQRMPTTMTITSPQSWEPKTYLREGAIYRDSSNNIIRLLSIREGYCVYAYVALGKPRSEIHGSVTGLTRRNAFEASFIFVAECVEDWNRSQRKSSERRVQPLYFPSSLGSINVAPLSGPQKKEVIMLPPFPRRLKRLKT